MPGISQERLTAQNWVWGMDVSHLQENVDWPTVKAAGIKFAFIKLTEGHEGKGSYEGQYYNARARALTALHNQIKIGYYHFARPGNLADIQADARTEAQNLITHLRDQVFPKPHFPLALDLEAYSSSIVWTNMGGEKAPTKLQTMRFAAAFINELKKNNYNAMLYSYPSFVASHLPANHIFGKLPLWVAHYRDAETELPAAVNGWGDDWKIWQYSGSGTLDGVSKQVDLNVMKKTYFDLF